MWFDVGGLHAAWRDVVGFVVAAGLGVGGLSAQTETALHGLEQVAHDFAAGGDLDVDALIAFAVEEGEGLAVTPVKILSHVAGALVTLGAQRAPLTVNFVGARARGAVRGVSGKRLDHVELVVAGWARVVRDKVEADVVVPGMHFCGGGP